MSADHCAVLHSTSVSLPVMAARRLAVGSIGCLSTAAVSGRLPGTAPYSMLTPVRTYAIGTNRAEQPQRHGALPELPGVCWFQCYRVELRSCIVHPHDEDEVQHDASFISVVSPCPAAQHSAWMTFHACMSSGLHVPCAAGGRARTRPERPADSSCRRRWGCRSPVGARPPRNVSSRAIGSVPVSCTAARLGW